jgi:hypothetical protein
VLKEQNGVIVTKKEFKLRDFGLFHRLCILCSVCMNRTCVGIISESSHAGEVLGAPQF